VEVKRPHVGGGADNYVKILKDELEASACWWRGLGWSDRKKNLAGSNPRTSAGPWVEWTKGPRRDHDPGFRFTNPPPRSLEPWQQHHHRVRLSRACKPEHRPWSYGA